MKKYVMYVNLIDIKESDENVQSLPVIEIVQLGDSRYLSLGMKHISTAILEAEAEVGEDNSALIPFFVKIWDGGEPGSPPLRERKRRKIDQ